MNHTLINLIISQFYFNKPLISLFLTNRNSFLSIENSQFSNFFKSAIYSTFSREIHLKKCQFSSFLDSSIKIDSSNTSFIDHYYIKQTFLEGYNDLVIIERVIFKWSKAERGGCISIHKSSISIKDTIFINNFAEIGGAVYILNGKYLNFSQTLFLNNQAVYDGAITADSEIEENLTNIIYLNITNNFAQKWSGGLRIDRSGGFLNRSYFLNNSALVCGGFFYFAWLPYHLDINFCFFGNNSSKARGGAVTCFHACQSISFLSSFFFSNQCKNSFNSISIEAILGNINVCNCYFSGKVEDEIGMTFSGSNLTIFECLFNMNEEKQSYHFHFTIKSPKFPEGLPTLY